jgi:hypothetical protein
MTTVDIPFEAREDAGRWMTYWHQIREVLRVRPRRVLAIGASAGVVESYLEHAGIEVTTADSIDALPTGFDVACAFDVLATRPLDELERGLAAVAAASTEHVFVTLPYRVSRIRWRFWWGDHILSLGSEFMWPWRRAPSGGFAWELSYPNTAKQITKRISAELDVVSRGFVKDDPRRYLWHLRRRKS